MTEQQKNKQAIRVFMQAHYTDERLAQLLAHAQDGKLSFHSCCCFIGISTADHALRPEIDEDTDKIAHLEMARQLAGARAAEIAFMSLGRYSVASPPRHADEARVRVLIPMVRAEMRRRSRQSAATPTPAAVEQIA